MSTTPARVSLFQTENTAVVPGTFRHTTTINHQGTVIAFAMTTRGEVRYKCLLLAAASAETTNDKDSWTDARRLEFPNQYVLLGAEGLRYHDIGPHDAAGRPLTDLRPGLTVDPYNSSTAKLSACAPFRVVSEGQYLYLFRQSKASPGAAESYDSNLLVDRYLWTGSALVSSPEARYKRSRHVTNPASERDSFSTTDMNGQRFVSPTKVVDRVGGLADEGGGFDVLLLPSESAEVKIWQIFWHARDEVTTKRRLWVMSAPYSDRLWISLRGAAARTIALDRDLDRTAGVSARLFYQREAVGDRTPMPTHAWVMLAVGLQVKEPPDQESTNYVGALAFRVGKDGTLADPGADPLALPMIEHTTIADSLAASNDLRAKQETILGEIRTIRATLTEHIVDLVDWADAPTLCDYAAAKTELTTLKAWAIGSGGVIPMHRDTETLAKVEAARLRYEAERSATRSHLERLEGAAKRYPSLETEVQESAGPYQLTRELTDPPAAVVAWKMDRGSDARLVIGTLAGQTMTYREYECVSVENGLTTTRHLHMAGLLDPKFSTEWSRPDVLTSWSGPAGQVLFAIKGTSARRYLVQDNNDGSRSFVADRTWSLTPSPSDLKVYAGGYTTNGNEIFCYGKKGSTSVNLKISLMEGINQANLIEDWGQVFALRRNGQPDPTMPGATTLWAEREEFVFYGTTCVVVDGNGPRIDRTLRFWSFTRDDRPALNRLLGVQDQLIASLEAIKRKYVAYQDCQNQIDTNTTSQLAGLSPSPMPLLGPPGCSGGVLRFTKTARESFLFHDSLGRVSLYFADATRAFFVGYFQPESHGDAECLGYWAPYSPGQALDFDVSTTSAADQRSLLKLVDVEKVASLVPTRRGLSFEAWVMPSKPRTPGDLQVVLLCQSSDQLEYSLTIRGDEDSYTATATVGKHTCAVPVPDGWNKWRHLACTFERYWALALGSDARLSHGRDPSLKLTDEFTIEFFGSVASDGIILRRGADYSLERQDGKLRFKLGGVEVLQAPLSDGDYHKLTIVRTREPLRDPAPAPSAPDASTPSDAGQASPWYEDLSGDALLREMARRQDALADRAALGPRATAGSQNPARTGDSYFTLFVDGVQHRNTTMYVDPGVRGTDPFLVGGALVQLDELRIWGRALTADECRLRAIGRDTRQLVSWWRVEEGQGAHVFDDAGNNHGVVVTADGDAVSDAAAVWIDSPDPDLPRLKVHVDGAQASPAQAPAPVWPAVPVRQFNIGGYAAANATYGHFNGNIEEIRVWGAQRTPEQIRDNAFGRLKGEQDELLANYSFDSYLGIWKFQLLAKLVGPDLAEKIWLDLIIADQLDWKGDLTADTGKASIESRRLVTLPMSRVDAALVLVDGNETFVYLVRDGRSWKYALPPDGAIGDLIDGPTRIARGQPPHEPFTAGGVTARFTFNGRLALVYRSGEKQRLHCWTNGSELDFELPASVKDTVNAAMSVADGSFHLFAGDNYHTCRYEPSGIVTVSPANLVGTRWRGLPGQVDAAFERGDRQYFFKGRECYVFLTSNGTPTPAEQAAVPISSLFVGAADFVDDIFVAGATADAAKWAVIDGRARAWRDDATAGALQSLSSVIPWAPEAELMLAEYVPQIEQFVLVADGLLITRFQPQGNDQLCPLDKFQGVPGDLDAIAVHPTQDRLLLLKGSKVYAIDIPGATGYESAAFTAVECFELPTASKVVRTDAAFTDHVRGTLQVAHDGVLETFSIDTPLRRRLRALLPAEDTRERTCSAIEQLLRQQEQPADFTAQILDLGPYGNDLQVTGVLPGGTMTASIRQVYSTAPVSTEIPEVRSAISGIETDYHDKIDGPPAVVEYGDTQRREDGTLRGVLKRCYSYVRDQQWNLVTGYKVGNLVTQWYGQAQYDAQIVGYIEGAPPVPMENLPLPSEGDVATQNAYAYSLDNSVTLQEAEAVSVSHASDKDIANRVTIESEAFLGAEISTVLAPFGIGINIKGTVGAKRRSVFEWSSSRFVSSEENVAINTSRRMRAALAAYPRELTEVDGTKKWYYTPGNTGYALVKSKTADIFLLRLEHTGAAVSMFLRPNPDVPEDQNIVPFPINPRYTKQGCLDGTFKGQPDALFPSAATGGEHSYYRPREAYRLKEQIEREQVELLVTQQALALDVAREHAGAVAGLALFHLAASLPTPGSFVGTALSHATNTAVMNGWADSSAGDPKFKPQGNLVNRFVWTIEGGTYTEEVQTSHSMRETISSKFDLSSSTGIGYQLALDGVASFNADFLLHHASSFNSTRTKAKQSERSFGLDVSVELPTSPRYRYSENGLDIRSTLIPPGTVDAYRFMSFYLEPQSENFAALFDPDSDRAVIDPVWLAGSEPSAILLRTAKERGQGIKPQCWRVMHRVTFVSRVLPSIDATRVGSLENAMRSADIDSNWGLIERFRGHVQGATTRAGLLSRVDAAIDTVPDLQRFDTHRVEVKRILADYFVSQLTDR